MKNRKSAQKLLDDISICTRCKKAGRHWVVTGSPNLEEILQAKAEGKTQLDTEGFWICPDLYDDNGRRKDTSDLPLTISSGIGGMGVLSALTQIHLNDKYGLKEAEQIVP